MKVKVETDGNGYGGQSMAFAESVWHIIHVMEIHSDVLLLNNEPLRQTSIIFNGFPTLCLFR